VLRTTGVGYSIELYDNDSAGIEYVAYINGVRSTGLVAASTAVAFPYTAPGDIRIAFGHLNMPNQFTFAEMAGQSSNLYMVGFYRIAY
jgi:hypothetical protein